MSRYDGQGGQERCREGGGREKGGLGRAVGGELGRGGRAGEGRAGEGRRRSVPHLGVATQVVSTLHISPTVVS